MKVHLLKDLPKKGYICPLVLFALKWIRDMVLSLLTKAKKI